MEAEISAGISKATVADRKLEKFADPSRQMKCKYRRTDALELSLGRLRPRLFGKLGKACPKASFADARTRSSLFSVVDLWTAPHADRG